MATSRHARRVSILLSVLLWPLALIFAANGCPLLGTALEPALAELNRCAAATELLGSPIVRAVVGCGLGSHESGGGGGHETFAFTVEGSKGRGRFSYWAEAHGGSWQVTSATLEADGKTIDMITCAVVASPAAAMRRVSF